MAGFLTLGASVLVVNRSWLALSALLALWFLVGCASQPRTGEALDHPAPAQAADEGEAWAGREVEWGGVITAGGNRADSSWLEILAYPLNADALPLTDRRPRGRFRMERAGYLELADFAPGRRATVRGVITGFVADHIGEAAYRFPVVHAERIQLWNARDLKSAQPPGIQFGIGLGVGF